MERTDLPWPQKRDASFPNSHDITRNERSAECIMRDVIHRWKPVESEKPVSSIHNPAQKYYFLIIATNIFFENDPCR